LLKQGAVPRLWESIALRNSLLALIGHNRPKIMWRLYTIFSERAQHVRLQEVVPEAGSVNDVDSRVQVVYTAEAGQFSCQWRSTVLSISENAKIL